MRFTRNSALAGLALTAALVLLCVPAPFQAQTVTMKVMIPFEFHVGEQTLPPGMYTIKPIGQALRVSDRNGHSATALSTPVSGRSIGSKDELIFTVYGSHYFLSQARWQGYNNARGLLKSKGEIELARATPGESLDLAGVVR